MVKQEIKLYFDANPLEQFSREDIISNFSHYNKEEVVEAITTLRKDGDITCTLPGRYPIYTTGNYSLVFKEALKEQELGIRTRLLIVAASGTRYNFQDKQQIINLFSERDEDGMSFYDKSVVAFIVDKMIDEGILRRLKNNSIRYIISSIPFKFDKSLNTHLHTLADGKMTFGVEHEFISKIEPHIVAHILRDNGFKSIADTEDYEEKYQYWHVGDDGSLETNSNYRYDVEVASRILKGKKGLEELDRYFRIIKMLEKMNLIKTDESAGIHVHHGSFRNDFDIKNLVANFSTSQSIMNVLFEEHRFDEEAYNYKAEVFRYIHRNGKINFNHDRTMNLNLNPFKLYGTVEFRQCESTFNASKVLTWVLIGQKLIKESSKSVFADEFNRLQDFFKLIKLNPKAQQIFKRKLNKAPIIA